MAVTRPPTERFWEKVSKTDTCWIWTAVKNNSGYGKFYANGRMVRAHRFAYELLVGPIPDGLQIDHLCRVRHCVNPARMEPVTNMENSRRGECGVPSGEKNRAKTNCPKGHPYDEANTYYYNNGSRQCRTCIRERARLQRLKRSLKVSA